MEILVCIKQVPVSSKVEMDPETGVLLRSGAAGKLNPYDLYALEAALALRDKYGGTVTALTMGPPQAKSALLEAVYMGADSGFLLSDRAFAGADVLATSTTLAAGVRQAGQCDLILCGKQTTDGDTAQVGPELAEFLGLPHACNVLSVAPGNDGTLTAEVNYEEFVQTVAIAMPCLLTIEKDANAPRLPSCKRRFQLAGEEPVRVLSLQDLPGTTAAQTGLKGSPTQVERIFPPQRSEGHELMRGDAPALAGRLLELLRAEKYV